ncbi:MAG: hypothetical protein CUN55_20795, partial [Phototrophicales bacterium]
RWNARFELHGNVLVDCAHNSRAFALLFEEIKRLHYGRLIMVVGFSKGKRVREIATMIEQNADSVILTAAANKRAASIQEIEKYFSHPILIKNPREALRYATSHASRNDLIVVA